MIIIYKKFALGTDQGPSWDEVKKTSLEGISGLVTRHPIYRLISSWNDKFSYNSTKGPGFRYGLKWLNDDLSMKLSFNSERIFANRSGFDEFSEFRFFSLS